MTQAERVKKVAKILKKRFQSMTDQDAVNIAYEIVEALEND